MGGGRGTGRGWGPGRIPAVRGPGARAEGQVDRGRHSGQREEPLHRKARGQEQVEQRLEGILTQEVGHGEQ